MNICISFFFLWLLVLLFFGNVKFRILKNSNCGSLRICLFKMELNINIILKNIFILKYIQNFNVS